jgi:hypothetical protein
MGAGRPPGFTRFLDDVHVGRLRKALNRGYDTDPPVAPRVPDEPRGLPVAGQNSNLKISGKIPCSFAKIPCSLQKIPCSIA